MMKWTVFSFRNSWRHWKMTHMRIFFLKVLIWRKFCWIVSHSESLTSEESTKGKTLWICVDIMCPMYALLSSFLCRYWVQLDYLILLFVRKSCDISLFVFSLRIPIFSSLRYFMVIMLLTSLSLFLSILSFLDVQKQISLPCCYFKLSIMGISSACIEKIGGVDGTEYTVLQTQFSSQSNLLGRRESW